MVNYFNDEECSEHRITPKLLKDLCKKHSLYSVPYLNDVLYLHYQGLFRIENLEEFTGLRSLWLGNNAIAKIENLDNQKDLRCLYLEHNMIGRIENLEHLKHLDFLSLCFNFIKKLENLSSLKINTLNISNNKLHTYEDLEHLKDCKYLSVVDLANNNLDDPKILEIFSRMPSLKVLILTGNPVRNMISYYRNNMICECKVLTYLDDRPVFPQDRAGAEAWKIGGVEAERRIRKELRDKELNAIRESALAVLKRHKEAVKSDKKTKKEGERNLIGETSLSDSSSSSSSSEKTNDESMKSNEEKSNDVRTLDTSSYDQRYTKEEQEQLKEGIEVLYNSGKHLGGIIEQEKSSSTDNEKNQDKWGTVDFVKVFSPGTKVCNPDVPEIMELNDSVPALEDVNGEPYAGDNRSNKGDEYSDLLNDLYNKKLLGPNVKEETNKKDHTLSQSLIDTNDLADDKTLPYLTVEEITNTPASYKLTETSSLNNISIRESEDQHFNSAEINENKHTKLLVTEEKIVKIEKNEPNATYELPIDKNLETKLMIQEMSDNKMADIPSVKEAVNKSNNLDISSAEEKCKIKLVLQEVSKSEKLKEQEVFVNESKNEETGENKPGEIKPSQETVDVKLKINDLPEAQNSGLPLNDKCFGKKPLIQELDVANTVELLDMQENFDTMVKCEEVSVNVISTESSTSEKDISTKLNSEKVNLEAQSKEKISSKLLLQEKSDIKGKEVLFKEESTSLQVNIEELNEARNTKSTVKLSSEVTFGNILDEKFELSVGNEEKSITELHTKKDHPIKSENCIVKVSPDYDIEQQSINTVQSSQFIFSNEDKLEISDQCKIIEVNEVGSDGMFADNLKCSQIFGDSNKKRQKRNYELFNIVQNSDKTNLSSDESDIDEESLELILNKTSTPSRCETKSKTTNFKPLIEIISQTSFEEDKTVIISETDLPQVVSSENQMGNQNEMEQKFYISVTGEKYLNEEIEKYSLKEPETNIEIPIYSTDECDNMEIVDEEIVTSNIPKLLIEELEPKFAPDMKKNIENELKDSDEEDIVFYSNSSVELSMARSQLK